MPIPMLPPPAPYVAPDLHPIAAKQRAELVFLRDAKTGRIVGRNLDHGLWLATENAPLDLRFHRRADGTLWAEQATYADGDRQGGIARVAAGAYTAPLSKRVVGGMGALRGFASFTIRTTDGKVVRRWSSAMCGGSGTVVRLDRTGSPAEPTFPTSWDSCVPAGGGAGFGSAYVLGRTIGLDRGWAMPLPTDTGKLALLAPGRYRLTLDLDPLQAVADTDRSNQSATVALVVKHEKVKPEPVEDADGGVTAGTATSLPASAVVVRNVATSPRGLVRHAHADGSTDEHRIVGLDGGVVEPEWYAAVLRRVEATVARGRAQVQAGGRPRGSAADAPAPPADVDLPNLRSAPSYGINTSTFETKTHGRRDVLRFGALTWNAGPGPLEVEAFRESGTTLDAYQVFSRNGVRSTRQARGTLVWHAAPGHDHFHFNAFANYTLTTPAGKVVRDGGKHSWCIVDTDLVDSTRPGASTARLFGGGGLAGGCGSDPGALWARLALSVGAGDYYGAGIAGQSFDISKLRNGTYQIRIEANPTGVIAETDRSDNVATRTIVLGGRPGARTVQVRPAPNVNDAAVEFGGKG